MDIQGWQRRLRNFAAARGWQAYHAPKNLAMALMVETAELLELFQWQTLTESRGFTREAQNKERVGDEMADVLLYLLQLADHCGVDLAQAAERKFARNAVKYPAKQAAPGPQVEPEPGPQPPAPAKVHLLVDWENVQPTGPALQVLAPEGTDVWLFHGPQQRLDVSSHQTAYGVGGVTQVPRSGAGRNALDFQLSYYVGYISARQPQAAFVVVSNDQGYDPMLEHARELGFCARRVEYRKLASAAPVATQIARPAVPAIPAIPAVAPPPAPPKMAATGAKLSRLEMQQLVLRLVDLPPARRPAHKAALLDWLQAQLGEIGAISTRVDNALARLRAQKLVVLKGDGVSYPAPAALAPPAGPAAPVSKAVPKSVPKAAAPKPPVLPAATLPKAAAPTAGQLLQRVLASLEKMPKNKPTRCAAMLKHITAQAGAVAPPAALAQQVLDLLVQKKRVIVSADGLRLSYPPQTTPKPLPTKKK